MSWVKDPLINLVYLPILSFTQVYNSPCKLGRNVILSFTRYITAPVNWDEMWGRFGQAVSR